MDNATIKSMIQMLEETSVKEFELQEGETKIRIVLGNRESFESIENVVPRISAEATNSSLPEKKESEAEETDLYKVESPIVGNYYSGPSPDSEPYVHVGSYVKKGDVLCIVEAMKFMNEIEAPVSGTIEKIFLSEGQVVEFGELLFLIKQH